MRVWWRGHRARSRRRPVALVLTGVTASLAVFLVAPGLQFRGNLGARAGAFLHTLAQEAGLAPRAPVQARTFGGTPAVGALFSLAGGRLGTDFCTASVVDSPRGDLILTAAHCVYGVAPSQIAFVPGYHAGRTPYGIWRVTRVFVDQSWKSATSPDDDAAFLTVAQPGKSPLERITGAERIGIAQPFDELVQVVGYPQGAAAPIYCENRTREFSSTQLEFDCGGYTDGTSGSPLLASVNPSTGLGTVIGVIGGYEQGGYSADVSYAARFSPSIATLYRLAAGA